MKLWRIVTTATVLTIPGAAFAEDATQDNIDWPAQSLFLNDTPQVQEAGRAQAQIGLQFRDTRDGSELEAPLQAQVGIAPRVELDAEVPWVQQREGGQVNRGVENLEVGGEYRLISSQESGFGLSAGVGVDVPIARPEIAEPEWALKPRMRAYKQLGVVGLNATVAPGVSMQDDGVRPVGEAGVGLTFGNGVVVPTLEARGEVGTQREADGIAGIRVKPTESVEIGAGALVGVHDGERVYGGVSQLIFELGAR